ncbi:phosphotransferase [Nocardioides sp. LHD-245]|uniref:phosphotransferase n=1 Tax=Nocardioides sp. LHD-245 TaxID=3051387 RepID=UPI0027DF5C0B|nr:phosphotransferase [Nocardioides sp. LHD-245]
MSTSTWTSAIWATEEFRAELRAFVTAAIGVPERVEEVSRRPWSVVWRVTVAGRTAYAKQNCPGQAHEARLMARLAQVVPEHVVPVLAAEPDRDLLLTADLGPTVREGGGGAELATWIRIATEASVVQRELVGATDDLGLTVLSPGDALTYVADAVGRLAALAPTDPRRLAPEVAILLESLLPTVGRWAELVEDLGLPLTLLHNDLHADNLVTAPDGTLRCFDLGDSLLGDPLAGLYVPLAMAQETLGLTTDDPRLWRIADAALEVWSDLAPPAALRAALPAALQLGRLGRVESWRRCVATMTPEERAVHGSAPADRLASLLDPGPLRT